MSQANKYERIEYSNTLEVDKEQAKRHLIESKDGELGYGTCHYCGKEFNELSLRVTFDIPLHLGGGLVEGNTVLACLSCIDWKERVDRIIVRFCKDMRYVVVNKIGAWNNIPLSQLHDFYNISIALWRDAENIINGPR